MESSPQSLNSRLWKSKRKPEKPTEKSTLNIQDTYYVGNFKGVGKVYQQTFVDIYSQKAEAKLYMDKTAITAANLLNDRVVPFYNKQNVPLLRILTDRGSEFCGRVEKHAFELFLSIEGIDRLIT